MRRKGSIRGGAVRLTALQEGHRRAKGKPNLHGFGVDYARRLHGLSTARRSTAGDDRHADQDRVAASRLRSALRRSCVFIGGAGPSGGAEPVEGWTSRSTQLHASAQVQIGGCEQLPVFAPGRWRSWRPWGSGEPITNGRFRQARRAAPVTNATAAADREVRPPVRDARCEPQTIREMLAIRRSFVLLCHDKPNRIKRSGYGISAP